MISVGTVDSFKVSEVREDETMETCEIRSRGSCQGPGRADSGHFTQELWARQLGIVGLGREKWISRSVDIGI